MPPDQTPAQSSCPGCGDPRPPLYDGLGNELPNDSVCGDCVARLAMRPGPFTVLAAAGALLGPSRERAGHDDGRWRRAR